LGGGGGAEVVTGIASVTGHEISAGSPGGVSEHEADRFHGEAFRVNSGSIYILKAVVGDARFERPTRIQEMDN